MLQLPQVGTEVSYSTWKGKESSDCVCTPAICMPLPVISNSIHWDFFPALTSSRGIKVCDLLGLLGSYLSLWRDIVLTAIEWQQSVSTSDYVWINDVISRNSQQIESPCVNTNTKEKSTVVQMKSFSRRREVREIPVGKEWEKTASSTRTNLQGDPGNWIMMVDRLEFFLQSNQ